MDKHGLILVAAFAIDLLVGDPRWLWHPVCAIGNLIATLEPRLRSVFPQGKTGEQWAGVALVGLLCCVSCTLTWGVLWAVEYFFGDTISWVIEVWLCGQLLATRSLYSQSMAVYHCLKVGDLHAARQAVSMIVGRDTAQLDQEGVTCATVETVAENFSDGVLAPMCFILLAGAPGAMFYKAVNTMDSMVGYQNQRYRHFGTAAAKLDDVLNFLPARLAGVVMVAVSPLLKLNTKNAWHTFVRDRKNHKSPNSAHTEAAVAGGLGVQLGGAHHYGGQLVVKPTIGDALRPICIEDIVLCNRWMVVSALIPVALMALILL